MEYKVIVGWDEEHMTYFVVESGFRTLPKAYRHPAHTANGALKSAGIAAKV